MNDTIIETEHWRVTIESQSDPEPPDFDFQGQVIYMHRGRVHTQHRDMAHGSLADEIQQAWDRWGHFETIERHLRINHDVVGFDLFHTPDGIFINVVTLDELKAWGFESVAAYKAKVGDQDPSHGNLRPWRAYTDGEVYGFVIEEKVTWVAEEPREYGSRDTWEHVDSCYGFFGRDDVEQSAREAFAGHVEDPELVG